jgi:aryl-alcohol dehydrogenase-like predicted oxidoreductase
MKTVPLGTRGPNTSVVGFGAWGISGRDWGETDDQQSKQALHRALDSGVNFIDTADVYGFGHSERLIGEVLNERRDPARVIIATKAGSDFYNDRRDGEGEGPIRQNMDRDYLIWAAEQSLRRLGVEALDILQLHSPDLDKLQRDDPWEALERLKRDGKIRHAGLSIQSFQETAHTSLVEQHADLLDSLQVRYNLLERQAEETLFPVTQKHGIGVIARIPLLFGVLTGKFTRDTRFGADDHRSINLSPDKLGGYLDQMDRMQPLFERYPDCTPAQVSLAFCISHPACHVVIPGAKTVAQVEDNVAASDLIVPHVDIPDRSL